MKPRTLARIAIKHIEDGSFSFDTEERKQEAIRQMRQIISGKPVGSNSPEDPIVEIHIGVYIPNFDYPIVPSDVVTGEPIVWQETNQYLVPGPGSHIVKGVGVSGECYFMSFLGSLAPFRNAVIKVDRYTDVKRAAHALVCTMTRILEKDALHGVTEQPLKMEYDALLEEWHTHDDVKAFEKDQHKLYIRWLSRWIEIHGRNPDTHMRVLKPLKKPTPLV
jgi:hypothetical protein